jgi:hypothetical protein
LMVMREELRVCYGYFLFLKYIKIIFFISIHLYNSEI